MDEGYASDNGIMNIYGIMSQILLILNDFMIYNNPNVDIQMVGGISILKHILADNTLKFKFIQKTDDIDIKFYTNDYAKNFQDINFYRILIFKKIFQVLSMNPYITKHVLVYSPINRRRQHELVLTTENLDSSLINLLNLLNRKKVMYDKTYFKKYFKKYNEKYNYDYSDETMELNQEEILEKSFNNMSFNEVKEDKYKYNPKYDRDLFVNEIYHNNPDYELISYCIYYYSDIDKKLIKHDVLDTSIVSPIYMVDSFFYTKCIKKDSDGNYKFDEIPLTTYNLYNIPPLKIESDVIDGCKYNDSMIDDNVKMIYKGTSLDKNDLRTTRKYLKYIIKYYQILYSLILKKNPLHINFLYRILSILRSSKYTSNNPKYTKYREIVENIDMKMYENDFIFSNRWDYARKFQEFLYKYWKSDGYKEMYNKDVFENINHEIDIYDPKEKRFNELIKGDYTDFDYRLNMRPKYFDSGSGSGSGNIGAGLPGSENVRVISFYKNKNEQIYNPWTGNLVKKNGAVGRRVLRCFTQDQVKNYQHNNLKVEKIFK